MKKGKLLVLTLILLLALSVSAVSADSISGDNSEDFEETFTVLYETTTGGSCVTITGSTVYGEEVAENESPTTTLYTYPDDGYEFVGYEMHGVLAESNQDFVITDDVTTNGEVTITATFEPIATTEEEKIIMVIYYCSSGGTCQDSSGNTITDSWQFKELIKTGTSPLALLTVTPNTGYQFIGYEMNGVYMDSNNDFLVTLDDVEDEKVIITATFESYVDLNPDYSIDSGINSSIDLNPGNIDLNPVATPFTVTYDAGDHGTLEGDTIELVTQGNSAENPPEVIPDDGYVFFGWNKGAMTTQNVSAFTINDHTTLTAKYTEDGSLDNSSNDNEEEITYRITLDGGEHGSLFATEEYYDIPAGETFNSIGVVPIVQADEGYTFVAWSKNNDPDSYISNIVNREINEDASFTAIYYDQNPQIDSDASDGDDTTTSDSNQSDSSLNASSDDNNQASGDTDDTDANDDTSGDPDTATDASDDNTPPSSDADIDASDSSNSDVTVDAPSDDIGTSGTDSNETVIATSNDAGTSGTDSNEHTDMETQDKSGVSIPTLIIIALLSILIVIGILLLLKQKGSKGADNKAPNKDVNEDKDKD